MDENPSIGGGGSDPVVFSIKENGMMRLVRMVFSINCSGVAVTVGMGMGE